MLSHKPNVTISAFIVFFLLLFQFSSNAQNSNASEFVFKNKVEFLYSNLIAHGFSKFKGANLTMKNKTEFPVLVDLQEGHWYHFFMVGDPTSTKIETKLGLEGYGDIITDKFKPESTNEFWTEFSFICPRSGKYLLTFYQRGREANPLGHIAILQRPSKTTDGELSFKN